MPMQVQGRGGDVATNHSQYSSRGRWVVSSQLLYHREKPYVHVVQKAGWASKPVWMGKENLAPKPCPDSAVVLTEGLNRHASFYYAFVRVNVTLSWSVHVKTRQERSTSCTAVLMFSYLYCMRT
jgi:hypothetical protein